MGFIFKLWNKKSIQLRLLILCLVSLLPFWVFMVQYFIPMVYESKLEDRKTALRQVVEVVSNQIEFNLDKVKENKNSTEEA